MHLIGYRFLWMLLFLGMHLQQNILLIIIFSTITYASPSLSASVLVDKLYGVCVLSKRRKY